MLSIPAAGMQSAQSLLALHAHNIANVSTDGPAEGNTWAGAAAGGADLAEDVVGLILAKTVYTANAKVLTTMAETERSLLDVRA